MPIQPGQMLSHYRLVEKIGEGGMGLVWKALDTTLDREVAVKILPAEFSGNPERLARFEREAKLLAALNHPNVATLHGFEREGDTSFLVMELVDGETLDRRIPDDGLTAEELLGLAVPLADALADAHRQELVHRDLKPGNVMVSSTGRLKVLDFGLAKLARGETAHPEAATRTATQGLTREGVVMGTVPYMSPEQLSGKDVDARSDVFSLGVVLYQMATGRLPFPGSGAELASAILRDTPPPVTAVNARLPEELGALIARCLAKAPDERPADAGEVRDRLLAIGESASAVWTRVGWAAALLLGVVAIASAVWFTRDGDVRLARLAVLPFENVGRAEDERLADGLTDDLTRRLAGVKSLAVISRSSTALYGGSGKNAREIGEELGADYILAGSVSWAGETGPDAMVRIVPRLIRAADAAEVWSKSMERSIDEGASVQSDIASQVVDELGVALSGEELGRLRRPPTTNALAYEAYLHGLHALPRGHGAEPDFREAERMFGQAVSLDADFALAWARLCDAHLGLYWFGYDVTESRLRLAFEAVRRALELDPGLPEARFMLGSYHYRRRDYDRALAEFAAVYEARPNDSELLSNIAFIWRRQGLFEQCLDNQERALQLNPRDVNSMIELSHTLAVVGEYDRAIELNRRVIELEPDNEWAYLLLSLTYWLRDGEGDLERARSSLEHFPDPRSSYPAAMRIGQELYEGNPEAARRLISNMSVPALSMQGSFQPRSLLAGLAWLASGDKSKARKELEEAVRFLEQEIERRPEDHRLPSALGLAYAGLGRSDEAVRAGQKGMELLPYSTDALLSTQRIFDMARIHALLGENEAALEYVKLLVSRPNDQGGARLRLSPSLARLRKDPRFWDLPPGYHVPRRRGESPRLETAP